MKWARDRHRPPGNWVQATGLLHVAGLRFREADLQKFSKAARAAEKAGLDYGSNWNPIRKTRTTRTRSK